MWKPQLRPVARLRQGPEQPFAVARAHEQIEVFGLPDDAGVALEGEGAADEGRHTGLAQDRQRVAVHGMRGILSGADRFHFPPPCASSLPPHRGGQIEQPDGPPAGHDCRSSGNATLYTGTPPLVRPSSAP